MFKFASLVPRYQEPHRYYHNLTHIEQMLIDLHQLNPRGTITLAQHLAVWFHDAVYDPTRNDNEERSAAVLYESVKECMNDTVIGTANALILNTRLHTLDLVVDSEHARFLDADLAGLGKSFDHYLTNTIKIRLEYHHLDNKEFKDSRLNFIEMMLKKRSIYYSVIGQYLYEAQARANLEQELKEYNKLQDRILAVYPVIAREFNLDLSQDQVLSLFY